MADKPCMTRTITITSGKGGVGKTNLSVNLALGLSLQGRSTCLFDADLGLANVNLLLGLYPEKSLKDVIAGRCRLSDIVVKTAGIDIIPGSSGVEALADLEDDRRDDLLETLSDLKKYDFVLFDTSAGISANVVSFCLSSPELILVIVPEVTSLTDAFALLKILARNGFSGMVQVAVNRCRSRSLGRQVFDKFRETVKQYLKFEIALLGIVSDDTSVEESVAAQEPFVQRHPDCTASRQVISMARGIIEKPPEDLYPGGAQSFWRNWVRHRTGSLQINVPAKTEKGETAPADEQSAPAVPTVPEEEEKPAALPEPSPGLPARRATHLPVLPAVALACIHACRSGEDVDRLVRLDAALAANVLELASGAGRLADPAASIEQAVAATDAGALEAMALSSAHFSCLRNRPPATALNLTRFWQHSLRCALLARQLAEETGLADPGEAYLAGLLHDIGKLAAPADSGGDSGEEALEAGKYPAHAAAGAGMLTGWGFSPLLADAVRYHHAPAADIRHAFSLVKIVFVANNLSCSSEGNGQRGLRHADQLLSVPPPDMQAMIRLSDDGVQEAAAGLGIDLTHTGNDRQPGKEKGDRQEENLFEMLRSRALLGGWLQSLLVTEETASVIDTACGTLRLLFNVSEPLFFVHDPQQERLVCRNAPAGTRLDIDLQTNRCLPVTCFRRGAMVTSLEEPGEIMDRQLARFQGGGRIACLPVSDKTTCHGVIVMAADKDQILQMKEQRSLLNLLTRQAARALDGNYP